MSWTAWIQHGGYAAVFLGVMAESMGVPFPGETIVITATLLVAPHGMQFAALYVVAVLGAVVGDNLGYWLGRRGGRPLLARLIRLWRLPPDTLARAESLFKRYGRWAIFLGRFVALLRTWAGPIAGATGFPWREFWMFNLGGAIVWVATVMALTRLFGAAIARLLHHAEWGALLLAFGMLVAWLLLRRARSR